MDLSRLSLGDKLVGGGAIVLIVSVFLGWYGVPSISVLGETISGGGSWSLIDARGGLSFLIITGAAVALAAIVLRMLDVFDLSDQNIPESIVVLVAAVVSGIFTLYAVVDAEGLSRKYGMWIGLAAAVVFAIGAVMKFQEERA